MLKVQNVSVEGFHSWDVHDRLVIARVTVVDYLEELGALLEKRGLVSWLALTE